MVGVVIDQYLGSMAETKFVLQNEHIDSFCRRWQELDPEGTGKISTWNFRTILERLHFDGNPMGSCALCDEFNHRSVRIEIMDGQDDCSYFEFHRTLRTLALRVAGAGALPYVEMIKRREQLAFYAQAAVLSKAALLYGKLRHAHNVQGNVIAQRALDASNAGNSFDEAAAVVPNRERTTFCFPLMGGDRMLVVDVCTASVVIQRGPRLDELEATFPISTLVFARVNADGSPSQTFRGSNGIRIRDVNTTSGSNSGSSNGVIVELCDSSSKDTRDGHDDSGTDDSGHSSQRRASLRTTCVHFFDDAQLHRFGAVVKILKQVTGENGEQHLAELHRKQVASGISPERDPLESLAMRYILSCAQGELQRSIRMVHDRYKKME
mmetsp:Transcript_80632/g.216045  ORF Transcript_80632/g.216045 Transcript_80632/m.216045 type:complete len:380 (-) Transcript_80632:303-1442(-)